MCPDGSGRIPPVAFNMSDDQYNRIFGKQNTEADYIRQAVEAFHRKRERLERAACKRKNRLDLPAEGGWGRVQGQEQAKDKEVRDVR